MSLILLKANEDLYGIFRPNPIIDCTPALAGAMFEDRGRERGQTYVFVVMRLTVKISLGGPDLRDDLVPPAKCSKSGPPQRNTQQREPVREYTRFSSNVTTKSAAVTQSEVFLRAM